MMVWFADWRGLCSVKINVCAHVFACVCVSERERGGVGDGEREVKGAYV